MRVRRTPSIQAHVTNRVDHPLLLAADAASAVALGFRELETTVPVLRDAPSNALALLVGSQVAAAGALTQCSVEERTELELGLRGLTTYAETVSVYGTEQVFVDGDDTPWSKAFLAACYASRGLKMRFTSGSGAECLMGAAEGRSMLYLEARCIAISRAAGAQGVQNGGIDGVSVTASVPDGMREVIAENLCVMLHDLESCAGNDTLMSFSDIRRTAHTLPLLLAGADFLFSGLRLHPGLRQRLRAVELQRRGPRRLPRRAARLGLRGRPAGAATTRRSCPCAGAPPRPAARSTRSSGLASFSDEDVEACVQAHGSLDVPLLCRRRSCPTPARPSTSAASAASTSCARSPRRATSVEAERVLEMLRQRLLGDYLQTAAIFDEDVRVQSNLSDPNDYAGPGHGLPHGRRAPGRRWRGCGRSGRRTSCSPTRLGAAGCLELRETRPRRARACGRTRS